MANVTLGFDELETGDLPHVCMECGTRREVDLIERRFVWRPLLAPPIVVMLATRRLVADIPLCPVHGAPRLFGYARNWWGLRTVAIGPDTLTVGGVHDDFVTALRRHREKRRRGELAAPRRRLRALQVGRGTGGGMTALKVLGYVVAAMMALVAVMTCGMFGLMGLAMLWTTRPGPPPVTPSPSGGPTANTVVQPEGVVVGLLGVAPEAGFPGASPWAALALSTRKETFNLLEDAELDRALTELKASNPGTVAGAANRLARARPTAARRREAAEALVVALANPFPAASDAAARALAVWGTSDNVPALVQRLDDPNPSTRAAAITALAGLKDERGAVAVARRLADFLDRARARQALEAMGPVAAPAVVPLVQHADTTTRVEACAVLQSIGTRDSLPALKEAARDPDQNVARAAANAIQAIESRP